MTYGAVAIHNSTDLPLLFPCKYGDGAVLAKAPTALSCNDECWERGSYAPDGAGYILLSAKGEQRRALHQILWERINQRKIPEGAVIHHVDCNPRNNSASNLLCLPRALHRELHGELSRLDAVLHPLTLELERHRITEFYRQRAEHYWRERHGAGEE